MDEYRTDNTKLAATMMAVGHRLVGIDKSSPRIAWIFLDSPELQRDLDLFLSNSLFVESQSLWQAWDNLKSRLFAIKDMQA